MYKLIIFDMDGTLAPSKSKIDEDMTGLLIELLKRYKVAIISGGDYPQFQKQVLPYISDNKDLLENLYICPTCGTKMYRYKNNSWEKSYSEDLSPEDRQLIIGTLENAMNKLNMRPEQTWGDIIEDRGTQITFSALGQQAPLEIKSKWDPDFKKRTMIRDYIKDILKDFSIGMGGSSSIDITKIGIDKAYGVLKLKDICGVDIEHMLFVGDALFEGGNDYPVKKLGVHSIQTENVDNTKKIIKDFLNLQK